MNIENITYTRDFTPKKDELLDELIAKNWFESTFKDVSKTFPSNFNVVFKAIADNPQQKAGLAYHDVPAIEAYEESHETVAIWPLSSDKTATDIFIMRKTYIEGTASPLEMYIVDAPEIYTPEAVPIHHSLRNIIHNIVTIYDVNDLWETDKTTFKDAELHLVQAWGELHNPEDQEYYMSA